jgi:hypothetical protein
MSLLCRCQMLTLRYFADSGLLTRRSCTDKRDLMLKCLTMISRFIDVAEQVFLRSYTGALALQSRYTGAFDSCAFLVLSLYRRCSAGTLNSFTGVLKQECLLQIQIWKFGDSAHEYRLCCTITLTLMYTGPYHSAFSIFDAQTQR